MFDSKPKSLRFGVFSEGTLTATPTQDMAISAYIQADGQLDANIYLSRPLEIAVQAEAGPKSTDFGDIFGPFTESGLEMAIISGFLTGNMIVGNDREVSPVTYEILDDTTLTYVDGVLSTVTSEAGQTVSLTYDVNGNLTEVYNTRTGTTKVLEYTNGELTKVISKKTN